ncbi:uncharacterized protein EV154DRAFT_568567 [Mucor mucedo]|uniref:uncharacterized protein n=1 Tax=Mucor mucedo TaxID=29922 RepID=UPI00221F64BB|nr:uncharacterized protein EV154DRAFT_568567 [Mucor mucedo]KAI7880027.1 hypothetical protein EV154DRAFT_568567 [Mucor mucedo]
MFSVLQFSGDFLNEDRWHNWKVLRGRSSSEKRLSGGSQWKTAKKALAHEENFTTRVTHGGRHASLMEAEGLIIPFDLIKRGGGWKDCLGRLEIHYVGKLPSPFARGMAGFWEKPFSLARNTVSPSLELQRTIFPLIESYFGVVQDVIAAINSPSIGRLEEYEGLVPNIVDTNKEVARRVAKATQRISHIQHQQDNRSEKSENSFNNYVNQNNQQNALMINMTQQLTKDLRILMMQQQCLNSQMQLMMATNNAFTNSNANTNLTEKFER